jgi:hypothetical protein
MPNKDRPSLSNPNLNSPNPSQGSLNNNRPLSPSLVRELPGPLAQRRRLAQQQPQAPPQTPQPNQVQQAQLVQAQQAQQAQQAAAAVANSIMQQSKRDAVNLKGQCLLKLMQFSEHLSGFPVSRPRPNAAACKLIAA